MSLADALLPEFDHETAATRTVLERVPQDRAAWKPHDKSMSLGDLAAHLVNLLGWAHFTLKEIGFETNPPDGQPATPGFESLPQLLGRYDEGVHATRAMLAATTDGEMLAPWTLRTGGRVMFTMPRASVFRMFIMNHTVHHRGQLTVYLRLCDVPLPPLYGPTADARAPE